MVGGWKREAADDRAWLMYSASYLMHTQGVRWAIDPVRLSQRLPAAPAVDHVRDLSTLSFVLLTHRHADHLDLGLLNALKQLPILWVIPEAMLSIVAREVGIPQERLIVPEPLHTVEIQGVRVTPFEGLHWAERDQQAGRSGAPHGVPAMGYLLEFAGKRWLFPGDIRIYDAAKLPRFENLDGMFAHLWLGRGAALRDDPPLVDDFCRFIGRLKPRRVIITHLEEFGRDARDYWDSRHAEGVRGKLREISPGAAVTTALMGESVPL